MHAQTHANAFWAQSTRTDGRSFSQPRTTSVVTSILKHSLGSASIQLGSTKIIAANTIEIGQPTPTAPDHGDVVVQVHRKGRNRNDDGGNRTCSTTNASYLQSWLQRQLSEFIPPYLNLLTGRATIRLIVTVLILQDDGNLMDASLLACMAAWNDTKLPVLGVDLEEQAGKLWWKKDPAKTWIRRPIKNPDADDMQIDDKNDAETQAQAQERQSKSELRFSLTVGIIRQHQQHGLDDVHNDDHDGDNDAAKRFLVDPTKQEMALMEGTITITIHVPSKLTQIEFTSPIPLDPSDFAVLSKMAEDRSNELLRVMQKS
uniref:Ribosomal RNA-processing protein 43 n=1 Tax=Craspedostauros australis TaxID=1486917 RepID=A0A7R9ZK08_9STRA|mmetsp:Transcript_13312/g.36780  ORF Transcript_13312/g.36780 Transcript_13312/m.36780 type:complete len:316 (+) Transcript_13312:93-1040(+)